MARRMSQVNWVSQAHLRRDAGLDAGFVQLQQLVQVALFGQLHQHVELLLVLERAQELHDVRVGEVLEDPDFPQ